jgi:hypothetical protein
MEKKYLFVGEYSDSYTGGSVVFISTKRFLKDFELNGLSVILDSTENCLYRMRKFPGSNGSGITPEEFWKLIDGGEFTQEFKNYLITVLSKDGDDYPGYRNKNIRVDWFPENDEGIYIVYEKEIDDESEDIVIISDTYYCA